jgi:hypothetical protein
MNAASFGSLGSSPNKETVCFFVSLGVQVVLVLLAMVGWFMRYSYQICVHLMCLVKKNQWTQYKIGV